jgi:hypothetical protein
VDSSVYYQTVFNSNISMNNQLVSAVFEKTRDEKLIPTKFVCMGKVWIPTKYIALKKNVQ